MARRKPHVSPADVPKPLGHVGLYLDRHLDADAAALAVIRGATKSAIYVAGLRMVFGQLTDDERAALAAMRTARKGTAT